MYQKAHTWFPTVSGSQVDKRSIWKFHGYMIGTSMVWDTCCTDVALKKLMQYSMRPMGILLAGKRESDPSGLSVPNDLASK